jgi:hypothetical protein
MTGYAIVAALATIGPVVLFFLDWEVSRHTHTACQYGITYSRKFIREHIEFAKSGKMVEQ